MLKTSCIKSLWSVLISILGEENSIYTYSNFQSDLLSSVLGLSSSQQELCNFCYTQIVSVTCVQVTFSNREKSTECGPNACPFSVPCDMNIIAAVQGADLTPPQKAASSREVHQGTRSLYLYYPELPAHPATLLSTVDERSHKTQPP